MCKKIYFKSDIIGSQEDITMKKYDLLIAGAGFAGASAAISAAREGMKVLVIDKSNCAGGAAVNSLVNPFMRYWTTDKDEKVYLQRGIFREVLDALSELDSYDENIRAFNEEYIKLIFNRMFLKEDIDILYNSYVYGAEMNDGSVISVKVANKSGTEEYFADYFIDATGDADLATICGYPCKLGRESDGLCQPMTLFFRVSNVDVPLFNKEYPEMQELFLQAKNDGRINNPREDILSFKFGKINPDTIGFNTTRVIKRNPVDAHDKTLAEIEAREQVFELFCLLKSNFSSFKDAVLVSTASEIGVRESRKIIGEYVLTEDDLLALRRFPDSIAVANYMIDIHSPDGSGTYRHRFGEMEYYTIPYRCLVPKDSKNLLVAGRCISSTHEAQSSYRIMPICSSIGEAAGVAIAVAKKNNSTVKDADVEAIQKILVDRGLKID